jgi:hypothetical protein
MIVIVFCVVVTLVVLLFGPLIDGVVALSLQGRGCNYNGDY